MREFKGTEGEFQKDLRMFDKDEKCSWIEIRDDQNRLVSEVKGHHYKIPNDECLHNANLFLASKDLLNLAIKVERHFTVVSETQERVFAPWEVDLWETAEKAINKALG